MLDCSNLKCSNVVAIEARDLIVFNDKTFRVSSVHDVLISVVVAIHYDVFYPCNTSL